MTTHTTPNLINKNLDDAVSHTTAEITRTDTKAGQIITLDGLLVAALSFLGTKLDGVALGAALIGALALVTSVVMALTVIRPRFFCKGRTDRASFVFWATADLADIEAGMTEDRRLARVQVLSRITLRKMRFIQLAGDASLIAVIAIAAAILTR
ncbi:Pycsar system effector family protein [Streptomyces sp. NPDC102264]|uniref:Pycsar system effector family protein n=1 Tax=Streptomyces sp. NPDC102264 TaxID=3366149 RepID=UPI003819AF93